MITFINETKIRNDDYVKEDFRATENITYTTADNQPKQKSMLMMKNTEQVLLAMKPLPPPPPLILRPLPNDSSTHVQNYVHIW